MPVNYTVWEKFLTPGRTPHQFIFSSIPLCRVEILHLNCQRQRDPLIGSFQVIAMQMRFSSYKLATLKERPCPQLAVCLVVSPMDGKKAPTLVNKTSLRNPDDLHGRQL